MTSRGVVRTVFGLIVGLITLPAAASLETQIEVNLTQDITTKDLHSFGKAWVLDTSTREPVATGALGGDHTIEKSGGVGPVVARIDFGPVDTYEAVLRALNNFAAR